MDFSPDEAVFLNFYAVSSMLTATFYSIFGIYLVFMVQRRSRAAFHLGMAYLFSAGLSWPYVFAHGVDLPYTAFHRWFTVSSVLILLTHYAQFLHNYPTPVRPRLRRTIMGAQYGLALIISAYFAVKTLGTEYRYIFAGHIWDFDADVLSAQVGGLILVYNFLVLVAGIWSVKRGPRGERATTAVMAGVIWISVFLPGITNVLSRDGLLFTRASHQTLMIGLAVVNIFTVFVIFVNNTRDRTTFMAKIISVTMASMLLMLLFIMTFAFYDQERAYDEIHIQQSRRMLENPAYRAPDVRYVIEYNPESGNDPYRFLKRDEKKETGAPENFIEDHQNTILFERLRSRADSNSPQSAQAIRDLLANAAAYSRGHAGYLLDLLQTNSQMDTHRLLERLKENRQWVEYRYNKLRVLPAEGFRAALESTIAAYKPNLAAYRRVIEEHLQNNPGQDGAELKREAMRYLRPTHGEASRIFRRYPDSFERFAAFLFYDSDKNRLYEVGFDYRAYRAFMHPTGLRLAALLGAAVLIVIVGFQFFFKGALVNPLQTLLAGVRRVNRGDLDVTVPVRVEDEIGYLAHSFNRMVKSIRGAKQRLERHADELEDKVRERTAKLRESLSTVQRLKEQQDADYFLTSLLIKPLATNEVEGDTVRVEFLTRQKKSFEFRRWKDEIGGDLCVASAVELQERACTVFINADAMGKSMQGAGGALVLGAVFRSIIERTRLVPSARAQSPERWLKNAFLELHKVFESFDGSMLVSLTLGLVDDQTGLVYFINAEHPQPVLFRKGKASFVGEPAPLRKLGWTIVDDNRIRVETLALEPGDVLIAGSDGRDDIALGTDSEGARIINEDETVFLRVVETSGARLSAIRSNLEEFGEITDDLSLLRISFRENDPSVERALAPEITEALAQSREHIKAGDYQSALRVLAPVHTNGTTPPQALKSLTRVHAALKDYAPALEAAMQYIEKAPDDTNMLYTTSYLARRVGRMDLAADLGERVRLRDREMIANLINLGEAHRAMGNLRRARKLIEEALDLDPDNPRARKLEAALAEPAGHA